MLQQTTLFNNIIGLYILYFGMYFKIYSKEVTMYVWCEHMVLCTYTVIESIDLSQFSGCKSDGVVALCFKWYRSVTTQSYSESEHWDAALSGYKLFFINAL